MKIPDWTGIISICVAIVAFGFLSLPMKLKCVRGTDPMVIQLFMFIPVLISCLIPLFVAKFQISYFGILGSLFWIPASCLSIFSVQLVGISIAQSVWSGMTMIISFLFGILIFKEKFKNLYCPIIGLLLLIFGVVIISISDIDFFSFLFAKKEGKEEKEETGIDYGAINSGEDYKEEIAKLDTISTKKKWIKYIVGVLLAMIMGILNAVSMVPAKMDTGNLMYIFTFGISQIFIGNFVIMNYFLVKTFLLKEIMFERISILKSALSGLICGTIWSVGYYAQVFSVFSSLGLSIGFILIQLTIIISTINGMLWFREISNWRKKIQFFIGFLLILPGAFLLFYFRKKQ